VPYVDVEWSSGDTPQETKLDNMYANLAYLRAELDYRQVASAGWSFGVVGYRPGNSSSWEWRIKLSLGSATSTARNFNSTEYTIDGFTSIDISALLDGYVHVFDIYVEARESGGSWSTLGTAGKVYFLKTPDVDRLSLSGHAMGVPNTTWTASASSYCVVYVHDLQVAGYRNTGDSTWVVVDFVGSPTPELVSDTDMNGMLTDADIVRERINARAIGSFPLFSTGSLVTQTTDDNKLFRLVIRVDGVEGATATFTKPDGWVTREVMNLDVSTLPDWTLSKVTVMPQYDLLGTWYDSGDGALAEVVFWNTPDVNYVTLRGEFRVRSGQSPGLIYWSTYRSLETMGFGLFATRATIT
jgi:hypothetical protein